MKKAVVIISVIAAVFLGTPLILRLLVSEAAKDISVSDIDLTTVPDGIYTGEYSASPVSVRVQIAVESQRITDIEILEHYNGLGGKAEKIADEIIGRQSLDVDTVSGATLSSVCILKAVENAFENK